MKCYRPGYRKNGKRMIIEQRIAQHGRRWYHHAIGTIEKNRAVLFVTGLKIPQWTVKGHRTCMSLQKETCCRSLLFLSVPNGSTNRQRNHQHEHTSTAIFLTFHNFLIRHQYYYLIGCCNIMNRIKM